MNIQELEYLLIQKVLSFIFDWFTISLHYKKRWVFLYFILLSQSILGLPDKTELQSLLEVVAECLVNEWRALLGVCEQQYLWRADVLLDKRLVIVGCDLDGLVLVESACLLF